MHLALKVTERLVEPVTAGSYTRTVDVGGGTSEVLTFKPFAKQRQLFDDFVNKNHRSVSDWQFSFGAGADDQDLPTCLPRAHATFRVQAGAGCITNYSYVRFLQRPAAWDVYYDALNKSTILRESCNIASPYVTNHVQSRVSTLHTTHIAHVLP